MIYQSVNQDQNQDNIIFYQD